MIKKIEINNSSINTKQQKASKKRDKTIYHDNEYINYIENGNSGAVFITRDIAKQIDTSKKWIDIVMIDSDKRYDKNTCNFLNEYKFFIVELFNKRDKPMYTKNMSIDEKKYLTWKVANGDIYKQRQEGISGPKYLVIPSLINLNKGKFTTIRAVWNKDLHRFSHDNWFSPACEWRDKKVPIKPDWQYKIQFTKQLNKQQFEYIQKNDYDIHFLIDINKVVKLEYFNLKQ